MRAFLAPLFTLLIVVSLSGCFMQNASPAKKLADSVHEMNEAVRWGRISHAAGHVEPEYLSRFMASREGWGEDIQVAMSDVHHLDVSPDNESATAVVSYNWYGYATMTLSKTTVRQTWTNQDGHFSLSDEVIVKGDPTLFNGKLESEILDEDGEISMLGDR